MPLADRSSTAFFNMLDRTIPPPGGSLSVCSAPTDSIWCHLVPDSTILQQSVRAQQAILQPQNVLSLQVCIEGTGREEDTHQRSNARTCVELKNSRISPCIRIPDREDASRCGACIGPSLARRSDVASFLRAAFQMRQIRDATERLQVQ